MTASRLLAPLLALLLLLGASPAHAADPWADDEAWKLLRKQEAKTLKGLLKTALKKDYRRQAWYLAERLSVIDPEDEQALDVLDKWAGAELQGGSDPKKAFLKKRSSTLEKLGDDYFHFGETLEASGMDPIKYYPINIRAHAYGSRAGNLVRALREADYVWLGVYGAKPRAEVDKLLGAYREEFEFPEEFDDEYLRARALWPEANGAIWSHWRLLTDHDYKEALRLLGMLALAERWLVDLMGSKAAKNDKGMTNLFVFSEHQKYDQIGPDLIREEDIDEFKGTSGWERRQRGGDRRLLVCWRHRDNGWIGDDDLMLGHAAKVMARRHLAGGAGGQVWGRGAWLLEGLRGAFEGFGPGEDGEGEIDPGACWRLAAAKALREQDKLIPWGEFFELDRKKAQAIPRANLTIEFAGKAREAKNVDVAAAQATAFVVGVMKADKGKGLKKLAKLLGDLYKRDSLPDVDKGLGWKKGRAIEEANRAMDAAHGRDAEGKN